MDHKAKTLEELAANRSKVGSINTLVGYDGFVDELVTAVQTRTGHGENFSGMPLIETFGKRILAAAGKSTQIELYPKMQKLGGNGPILANALLSAGFKTRYIGALGAPDIHPVFKEFAEKSEAISICDPAVTFALEFDDGKIMLNTPSVLDKVSYENVIEHMGEGAFFDLVSKCDLFAMVNWTCIMTMNDIFVALLEKVYPNLGPSENRHFFFDLADPEKRADSDLKAGLDLIARFQSHGSVTLGLNLKEGQHIYQLLGNSAVEANADGLKLMCSTIRNELQIACVVIHPTDGAACATKDDTYYVKGPYCEKPLITTGAGDHFNAGFMTGRTIGLSPLSCLTIAVCFSGSYVRTAKSPALADIDSFISDWK